MPHKKVPTQNLSSQEVHDNHCIADAIFAITWNKYTVSYAYRSRTLPPLSSSSSSQLELDYHVCVKK